MEAFSNLNRSEMINLALLGALIFVGIKFYGKISEVETDITRVANQIEVLKPKVEPIVEVAKKVNTLASKFGL